MTNTTPISTSRPVARRFMRVSCACLASASATCGIGLIVLVGGAGGGAGPLESYTRPPAARDQPIALRPRPEHARHQGLALHRARSVAVAVGVLHVAAGGVLAPAAVVVVLGVQGDA